MSKLSLKDRLQQDKPLLADGAMGTLIHERAQTSMHTCFDELNLTQPDLIVRNHWDYLSAGADLIETNTFGANRYKLAKNGLDDKVVEINTTAVQLAQRAIQASGKTEVYILGSMGPIGVRLKPYGNLTQEKAHQAFHEQAQALIDAGVDGILLETFNDHHEALVAVQAVRDISPDLPIIAQVTFTEAQRTYTGELPARVAHDLALATVDVIGVNCGSGPMQITHILKQMHEAIPNATLSVMPNAGYPEHIGNRVMYSASPDYFGDYALRFQSIGATIIGGCCGTKPEHISAMRNALDNPREFVLDIQFPDEVDDEPAILPEHPTALLERMRKGEFTITVEMAPPRSFQVEKLLSQARLLRDAGSDFLNVADTPAARMKMSAWAVCHLLQSRLGIETVLHFPTRGRNLLRVQGDLLAAHALDLRNLFVVMGDPTRIGDYPDAMDTYDIVPSSLIDLIKHSMNQGEDAAGNSIGNPTHFTVGCALNMAADDLDREIRVLRKKLDAGADFALGQAVFEPSRIARFKARYEAVEGKPFDLPVLMGVMPLRNIRHAQFLHNEVPGVHIPDAILHRIESAGDDASHEGILIAHELVEQMQGDIQGAYVIPSHGRYDLAARVVDGVKSRLTERV